MGALGGELEGPFQQEGGHARRPLQAGQEREFVELAEVRPRPAGEPLATHSCCCIEGLITKAQRADWPIIGEHRGAQAARAELAATRFARTSGRSEIKAPCELMIISHCVA